jgi:hypothetical protein
MKTQLVEMTKTFGIIVMIIAGIATMIMAVTDTIHPYWTLPAVLWTTVWVCKLATKLNLL